MFWLGFMLGIIVAEITIIIYLALVIGGKE